MPGKEFEHGCDSQTLHDNRRVFYPRQRGAETAKSSANTAYEAVAGHRPGYRRRSGSLVSKQTDSSHIATDTLDGRTRNHRRIFLPVPIRQI
jgi:hypothetical protein